MGSRQRYERVRLTSPHNSHRLTRHEHYRRLTHGLVQVADDENDAATMTPPSHTVPASPPPSFRSRTSSRSRRLSRDGVRETQEQRNLNDAFDAPSDDESDKDDYTPDQRRLIPSVNTPSRTPSNDSAAATNNNSRPTQPTRTVTAIPVFTPTPATGRTVANNSQANDGVWANLNAKPRPGDDLEEKPPTYEQAAADATPPYWETTVLSPYGTSGNPDDVFIDGLLVGSLFSFVWNALISMSFQLIGFLLTYLLHTTHAAKHGSRAGLGITLVQYGFQMRYVAQSPMDGVAPGSGNGEGVPENPNKHDFDPSNGDGGNGGLLTGMTTTDWLSYVLMIVGWFILIRSVSDFMKARRQEAIVRSSPERGLGVAVVAEGETPASAV